MINLFSRECLRLGFMAVLDPVIDFISGEISDAHANHRKHTESNQSIVFLAPKFGALNR